MYRCPKVPLRHTFRKTKNLLNRQRLIELCILKVQQGYCYRVQGDFENQSNQAVTPKLYVTSPVLIQATALWRTALGCFRRQLGSKPATHNQIHNLVCMRREAPLSRMLPFHSPSLPSPPPKLLSTYSFKFKKHSFHLHWLSHIACQLGRVVNERTQNLMG